MGKISGREGRPNSEIIGNIEISPLLQNFQTGFIDHTNNVTLRTLRTILQTAAPPRAGRLPQEDTDWKGELAEFSRLRANYMARMAVLQIRYSKVPNHPAIEKMTEYFNILKAFDPGLLKNPDMGEVFTEMEKFMGRFKTET